MVKIISGVIIDQTQALTLAEFCQALSIPKELLMQMIDYQLIQPQGNNPEEWRFDSISLRRGRIAVSFYHDLEVNLTGIALALELLRQIEQLQHQLNVLGNKKTNN